MASEKDGWISVETDDLPPFYVTVRVLPGDREARMQRGRYDGRTWWEVDGERVADITHWKLIVQ